MFIIGHRGSAGLKPENSMASLRAGFLADVDMLEFDIRLTKDKIPVLVHDSSLRRTHKMHYYVNKVTFLELRKHTARTVSPAVSLEKVLKKYAGKVLLNIELKDRNTAKYVLPLIEPYIKTPEDWHLFLFSSFRVSELKYIRKHQPHAQLALLHWTYPLRFLFVHRSLRLTAIGFHRLYVNEFALGAAKKLGLFVYAFTVNRPEAALRLFERGVDGIVTDVPHAVRKYLDRQGITRTEI